MDVRPLNIMQVSLFALIVSISCLQAGTGDVTPPDRRWKVCCIGVEIVGMKKEVKISAETARRIFTNGPVNVREGWEKVLIGKIENVSNQRDADSVPDSAAVWNESTDKRPIAMVVEFSRRELTIILAVRRGNLLWQHFYECKARLCVPRTKEIDEWLDVPELEKRYGAAYKGLKQGDTVGDIKKKLGVPDGIGYFQTGDYYEAYYFQDDVIFLIRGPGEGQPGEDRGVIEELRFGVGRFKDEVKKRGRHIIR